MNVLVCAGWYTCSPLFFAWVWALCLQMKQVYSFQAGAPAAPHRLNAEEDSPQCTGFLLNTNIYKRLLFCTDKGDLDGKNFQNTSSQTLHVQH